MAHASTRSVIIGTSQGIFHVMDHVIHHLSRSLLRSHGSTNEVHVYNLQWLLCVLL